MATNKVNYVDMKKLMEEVRGRLSDNAKDYVDNQDIDSDDYFCDSFTEYADNNTSCYYSDQKEFYLEHSSECDEAMSELYSDEDIGRMAREKGIEGLLCEAGKIGEYMNIEQDLENDLLNICKYLALEYIINDGFIAMTEENIKNIFDNLSTLDSNDMISDIISLII